LRNRDPKTNNRRQETTVTKSFRIPRHIVEILASDARDNGVTATDLLVSILTRYAGYDRLAEKFGFIVINKGLLGVMLDALPDERVKEIAISQSEAILEIAEFWFKKKDLDAVLASIDLFSKYMRRFEYTTSRNENEQVITMRSDMGRK
jgi:hypothetical protein